eukprot:473686_1
MDTKQNHQIKIENELERLIQCRMEEMIVNLLHIEKEMFKIFGLDSLNKKQSFMMCKHLTLIKQIGTKYQEIILKILSDVIKEEKEEEEPMAIDQHPQNDSETVPAPTVLIANDHEDALCVAMKEEKTEDQPPINQHSQNDDNELSESIHAPIHTPSTTVAVKQEEDISNSSNCGSESQKIKIQRMRNTLYVSYRNLRCDIDNCSILFGWYQDFECHMADIHSIDRPYQCPNCDKAYEIRSKLIEHVERKHLKRRDHKCLECGKEFYFKSNLASHTRIHTGETPYKCDTCGQSFKQFGHLSVHLRIHTGEKPYQCDICDYASTTNGQLAVHKRIHTGEKPYGCDICGKCFTQNVSLTVHKRIHSGEKPYDCR